MVREKISSQTDRPTDGRTERQTQALHMLHFKHCPTLLIPHNLWFVTTFDFYNLWFLFILPRSDSQYIWFPATIASSQSLIPRNLQFPTTSGSLPLLSFLTTSAFTQSPIPTSLISYRFWIFNFLIPYNRCFLTTPDSHNLRFLATDNSYNLWSLKPLTLHKLWFLIPLIFYNLNPHNLWISQPLIPHNYNNPTIPIPHNQSSV